MTIQENAPLIEKMELVVGDPILINNENQDELMNECLPLLNQFAPESVTRTFFTERKSNTYITLVKARDSKDGKEKIVGASGFKIDQPETKKGGGKPVKVMYRSFTFIGPEARGGGQYSIIQTKVEKMAQKEGAEYQALRTQNGRVWETAQKSFKDGDTYPNPKTAEAEIPEEVTAIAQYYNMNPDGTEKPMKNLVTLTPFYAQLAPVERKCKDPSNTEFLENLFREADILFKEKGLVDQEQEFGGIESVHPYAIMVVSKFKQEEAD